MTQLVWLVLGTGYFIRRGLNGLDTHYGFPYIRISDHGFMTVMSIAANDAGVPDEYFDTLEQAKEYVETAVDLGLEKPI